MTQRRGLILLAVLFAVTTGLRLRFAWTTLQFVFQADRMPKIDLPVDSRLNFLIDDKEIRKGDQLRSIDGEEIHSRGQAARHMTRKQVGDPVRFAVNRAGIPVTVERAVEMQSEPPGPYLGAGFVTLNILTPLFGSLLGFFVVFRRPADRLAWELLVTLFGLSGMAVLNGYLIHGWEVWCSLPAQLLAAPSLYMFATGWLWFALDFPDPDAPGKVAPWLRWPLTVFAAIMGTLMALDALRGMEFPVALAWVRAVLGPVPDSLVRIPIILAIGTGFANLGIKSGTELRPDYRRRLRLVYWGLTAGLTPLTALQFYGWFSHKNLNDMPISIWLPALMMLFLVPATLAYALVVHKAMDVGVVLRKGLQYALARRSTDALRLLLSAGLAWMLVETIRKPAGGKWLALPASLVLVAAIRIGIPRLRAWIDRRFFREAINTERVLTDLSEQLRTIVEPQRLLNTVTERVAAAFHARDVWALHRSRESFLCEGAPPLAANAALTAQLRSGPAAVYLERPAPWLAALPDTEKQVLRAIATELLVPVWAKDDLLAILALGPRKSEEPYSRADIRLLETVAGQTALALQNAQLANTVAEQAAQRERLQREIEIARDVQMRLLPKKRPQVAGLDYAGHCRPAQMIGGDYFDYFETPSGEFAFAIGDIAGKGIPAALLMSNLQAGLRA